MKYAIIKAVNGNFFIHAEGFEDVNKAKVSAFQLCASLANAKEKVDATVIVMDDQLGLQNDTFVHIVHDAQTS